MRVLFLTPHPIEGPSSRFRVYQFLPYLREQGVAAVVYPFVSSPFLRMAFQPGRSLAKTAGFVWFTLRRCWRLLNARRADVVFVHREVFPFGPPLLERALRGLSRRVVLDFDDAIFLRSAIYSNAWDRLRDMTKPARVMKMVDHVIVGNEFLRDHALEHCPRVTVLPTVVDTAHYRPRQRTAAGPMTVGWIGTPSSAGYLMGLRPSLRALARRVSVRFHFVGVEPFPVEDLDVRFSPWSLARERADLETFDIGIMPLRNDDEGRGKCGLKLLQYMAMGMPAVASPVGVNSEIISHGDNGLLAQTGADWIDALYRLVVDPALRRRLGEAGRATVEHRYSLASTAPRLLEVLHAVGAR